MTVKRKPDSEEFQEVKLGWNTKTFRMAIFVLIASMHPWGQTMLLALGFPAPASSTAAIARDVENLKQDVKDVKSDVADVRAEQRRVRFVLSGFPKPGIDIDPNK